MKKPTLEFLRWTLEFQCGNSNVQHRNSNVGFPTPTQEFPGQGTDYYLLFLKKQYQDDAYTLSQIVGNCIVSNYDFPCWFDIIDRNSNDEANRAFCSLMRFKCSDIVWFPAYSQYISIRQRKGGQLCILGQEMGFKTMLQAKYPHFQGKWEFLHIYYKLQILNYQVEFSPSFLPSSLPPSLHQSIFFSMYGIMNLVSLLLYN